MIKHEINLEAIQERKINYSFEIESAEGINIKRIQKVLIENIYLNKTTNHTYKIGTILELNIDNKTVKVKVVKADVEDDCKVYLRK